MTMSIQAGIVSLPRCFPNRYYPHDAVLTTEICLKRRHDAIPVVCSVFNARAAIVFASVSVLELNKDKKWYEGANPWCCQPRRAEIDSFVMEGT